MKLKSLLFAIVTAIVVPTALMGFRAAQSRTAAGQARAAVRARTSVISTKLSELEARRRSVAQAQERLPAELARSRNTQASSPAASSKRLADSPVPSAGATDDEMTDAKLQLLSIAAKQSDLAVTHGPFYRAHRLTPAQIEKLAHLLAQHEATLQDITAVARAKGIRPNDSAIVAQREAAAAELGAAGTALLGESVYAALQDYERTVPVRAFVSILAGTAALVGVPLTAAQGEDLTRVLAAANNAYVHGGGKAELGSINWTQAETAARSVLSPDQFELFIRTDLEGSGPSRWSAQVTHATIRALQAYAQNTPRPNP
jgi:hypothetical protein